MGVRVFSLLCKHNTTKISHLMNIFRARFCLMMLCFSLPFGWCWGQVLHSSQDPSHSVQWGVGEGLHSSTNPNGWVGALPVSPEDAQREKDATLKEPVIPSENLDTKQMTEETGTLYETGMATYYSAKTHGRMMANGTRYDKNQLFCAHKKLPFGTRVRVVNKKNGKEVIVDVRDRGPFAKGRVIDLRNKAAELLGMLSDGVVPVELWVVEPKN